ncbi:MAG: L,D-transpeptidase family protein [Pseudomonadota bacterium]
MTRRVVLGLLTSGLAMGAGASRASAALTGLSGMTFDDPVVEKFYRDRAYSPLWTGQGDGPRRRVALQAFDRAGDHGLPVPRYDAKVLRAGFGAAQSAADLGRLELAMTRALLDFARDLSSGALEPIRIDDGIKRKIVRPDPALILAQADSPDFAVWLKSLVPSYPAYSRLMAEKIALEALVADGGYGPGLSAEEIKPEASPADIIALRDRLIALGYLNRSFAKTFDASLQAAVQRFQANNGISPDGVVGKGTLAALNVSAQDRLKSVIVAMERLRWMGNADLGSRHIWVNQPDFFAKVFDDGAVSFETRVVIGKIGHDTQSPEFSDLMEFMVVNPTWSVPRSIVVKEYLPQFQKDPMAESQLQLLDPDGKVIDRSSVNFAAFTPENFPYALRQPPEDGNALGKVKFMFPNPYNIYLHDTPTKSLFAKEVRAFSHGCIRVGAPFDLAYFLLARQSDNPKALFASYLNTGAEAVLNLDQPVPVHLVYFTAWPDDEGRMGYRRDIYGRDAKLFAALAEAGVALAGVQS